MSLINQALKLEQQRRHTESAPVPPMVSRLANQRQSSSRWPMILLGMTGMGALLAVSLTAVFYFGSGYLSKGERDLALSIPSEEISSQAIPVPDKKPAESTANQGDPEEIEALLGSLSNDELSTVQQMLREREASQTATDGKEERASQPQQTAVSPDLAKLSKIQEVVDGFSIQGIRKAGKDSRVFLNGKIQRIGDIVEIEHSIVFVGFTDTALVFKIPSGHAFKKPL